MDVAAWFDPIFFVFLPYVAFFTFFLVTIARYRIQKFTYSSLSSQFLENQQHFWALVPFHYGILIALTGHIIGFLLPKLVLAWNASPSRLYALEIGALAAGFLSLIGFVAIVVRRVSNSKIRVVTTSADWVVFALLLLQIAGGIGVAVMYPWGSSWFAAAATPYLWSLVRFSPATGSITLLPWLVKFHIVNAYLLIGFFPFSRLVHILVVPNPYLWRRPQVVRWYRRRPAGIV